MTTPLPSPARAIKTSLKFLLTGVFVILGIFLVIPHISAAALFTEDFEGCTLGQYIEDACSGWNSNDSFLVVNQDCIQGEQCIFASTPESTGGWRTDTGLATGTLGFWFKYENTGGVLVGWFLGQISGWWLAEIHIINNDLYFNYDGIGEDRIFYDISENVWHYFSFEWAGGSSVRFNLDGVSTEWLGGQPCAFISYFGIYIYPQEGSYLMLDDFGEKTFACSQITNSFDCAVAGCVWHFWPFPGLIPEITFCSESPSGDCGSGLFDCPNCLTQETCEAQTCYWYQGRCSFTGGAICGEGLLTQFCENEIDCTNAGGFWYTDFCWLSEKSTNLLDWNDYYDENGDYATPTTWITGIASSTNGFFGTIGGFLSTFSENFNLTDAYNKGFAFGSAIPLARSYLGILDEFTGNLPFGEFFIFILIFTLAVGVFRIVRNLAQLLKFW